MLRLYPYYLDFNEDLPDVTALGACNRIFFRANLGKMGKGFVQDIAEMEKRKAFVGSSLEKTTLTRRGRTNSIYAKLIYIGN